MHSGLRGFYLLATTGLFFSLGWVGAHHSFATPDICLFHRVTSLPCPSCGTTRSIQAVLHGQFETALWLNPLGYLALVCLIVLPVWLLRDLVRQQASLYQTYQYLEATIRKPKYAIPAIALMLANWCWNLVKTL